MYEFDIRELHNEVIIDGDCTIPQVPTSRMVRATIMKELERKEGWHLGTFIGTIKSDEGSYRCSSTISPPLTEDGKLVELLLEGEKQLEKDDGKRYDNLDSAVRIAKGDRGTKSSTYDDIRIYCVHIQKTCAPQIILEERRKRRS